MLSLRDSLVVVGCVFVGFVTSAGPGLVARAAEPPPRLEPALAPSDSTRVPDRGEAQRRVAQLEQLEAERRGATSDDAASGKASRELEAVLAHNRELTARNRALEALAQSHLFVPPATAKACEPPPSADPRAQIRYWAQLLRDGDTGSHARLTTQQYAAVQVLLRPERELDPRNPWRELGPKALASAK